MTVDERATRWNHNIEYHRLVLESLPRRARTALDVGTGDGLLAYDLATRVPEVTAIDVDADVLARARGGSRSMFAGFRATS